MKTAEEWQQHWQSITQHWIAQECWDKEDYVNNFVSVLKEVQLDAMKEGARRASEMFPGKDSNDRGGRFVYSGWEIHNMIRRCESWTERDL